ncbi:septum formation initiator [Micromonospora sp. WMMD1082]|uniref:septum formation initiator n=1 Tax=Micromonospora sp. WMMD1082 TaxID=3016104 RepID=UPI002416A590|nr:septum formation initiator [Micromonospora sp. WMMD1082]MDG4797649.1 septum formation initiator [Micromonospora sp. WMMD1082]
MGRRTLLAVVGWLAAAVAATLISTGAMRLIGPSIGDAPGLVLSQADVARELETTPTPTPTMTPMMSPTSGPTPLGPAGVRRLFATPGGTVIAECVGRDNVYVVSLVPAQGFAVTDVDRGPDEEAEVEFAGFDQEVEIKIRCVNGELVASQDD